MLAGLLLFAQVLSTNWGEIKEKDYDKEKQDGTLKPPDGQEWKKWG